MEPDPPTRPTPSARPRLTLASTSRYRRELLERLRMPFDVVAPEVDETPFPGETPCAVALRLSLAKAMAIARNRPAALVIGSDQTATIDGRTIIGKPGDARRAFEQLRSASGRQVVFHTGLALVGLDIGFERVVHVDTTVRFRELDDGGIRAYLDAEQPFDCAGSAKVEALGITLLESVQSPDPTALIGLPLIALTTLLAQAGAPVIGGALR
jgi:septum formation protein